MVQIQSRDASQRGYRPILSLQKRVQGRKSSEGHSRWISLGENKEVRVMLLLLCYFAICDCCNDAFTNPIREATIRPTLDELVQFENRHHRDLSDEWNDVALSPQQSENKKRPLSSACLTVLRLMHEMGLGAKSKFTPYLDILPTSHRIPIQWTSHEKALLVGTAVEPLLNIGGSLEDQFSIFLELKKVHPRLWDDSVINVAAFGKAINLVRSRGFTIFGEPYLIPGADMFNHGPPERQSARLITDEDEEWFTMTSTKPIAAGEEIMTSFGSGLSNAHLCNSYGFVLKDNPYDYVLFPSEFVLEACKESFFALNGGCVDGLPADKLEDMWMSRVKMLESSGSGLPKEPFQLSKFDLCPESLMETVVLLLMTEDELATQAAVMSCCEKCLKQYNTSASLTAKTTKGGVQTDEGDNPIPKGVGEDAFRLSKAIVEEESKLLLDLISQLRVACQEVNDSDASNGSEQGGPNSVEDEDVSNSLIHHRWKRGKGKKRRRR